MLPLEDDDQHAGDERQEHDPVGEHEPVAAVGELAGQEAVAGDDRRQPREVGVGRVGGQDQDRERGDLGDPEQHALAAVDVLAPSARCRSGRSRRGTAGGAAASTETPRKQRAEDHAHDGDRRRRVLRLRLAERRHAVGHRLDAGQRDGARRERPQQHQQAERLRCPWRSSRASVATGRPSGIGPRSWTKIR